MKPTGCWAFCKSYRVFVRAVKSAAKTSWRLQSKPSSYDPKRERDPRQILRSVILGKKKLHTYNRHYIARQNVSILAHDTLLTKVNVINISTEHLIHKSTGNTEVMTEKLTLQRIR